MSDEEKKAIDKLKRSANYFVMPIYETKIILELIEKQQKEIADMEDFIARNLARASTTRRAQSRRKQLEKLERINKPKGDERSAFFSFSPERESGNVVVQANELTIGYQPDTVLSENVSLDIRKGDTIALIGPNGYRGKVLMDLTDEELEKMKASAEALKSVISQIEI